MHSKELHAAMFRWICVGVVTLLVPTASYSQPPIAIEAEPFRSSIKPAANRFDDLGKLPRDTPKFRAIQTFGNTRFRHASSITQILHIPQREQLLTTARDSTCRLWDLKSGNEIRRMQHPGDVDVWNAQLVGKDQSQVLTCGEKMILLWDLKTGKQLKKFLLSGTILRMAMVPGKRQFVTAGPSSVAQLRDLDTGKVIRSFKGHRESVYTVAVTRDGNQVITAGDDNRIFVFDRESGKKLMTLSPAHKEDVKTIEISPDGKSMVSCSDDKRVVCWNTSDWSTSWEKQLPNGLTIVRWRQDGEQIAVTCDDEKIYLLNSSTGNIEKKIETQTDGTWAVEWLHESSRIVSEGNQLLRIFDASKGTAQFPTTQTDAPQTNVAYGELISFHQNPDGSVCICGEDPYLRLYQPDGKLKSIIDLKPKKRSDRVTDCDFSRDGSWAVLRVGTNVKLVSLGANDEWIREKGKHLDKVELPEDYFIGPRLCSNDQKLVYSEDMRTIRLLDLKTGAIEKSEHQPGEDFDLFATINRGKSLVFQEDGTNVVTQLDGSRGAMVQQIVIHDESQSFQFSRQGLRFVVLEGDHNLAVFGPRINRHANPPSEQQIKSWFKDLQSPKFAVRKKAQVNLARSGPIVEKYIPQIHNPTVEERYRFGELRKALAKLEVPDQKLGRIFLPDVEIIAACISDSGKYWAAGVEKNNVAQVVFGEYRDGKLNPLATASNPHFTTTIEFGKDENHILTGNGNGTVTLYKFQAK